MNQVEMTYDRVIDAGMAKEQARIVLHFHNTHWFGGQHHFKV